MSTSTADAAPTLPQEGTTARRRLVRLPYALRPVFSDVGLVAAAFFLALSLVPSLLPRTSLMQGIVTGASLAIGYGIGAGLEALWRFFQIPAVTGRARSIVLAALFAVLGVWVIGNFWRYVGWQNEAREFYGMPPVNPGEWIIIIPVALALGALILAISRLLRLMFRALRHLLLRVMPERSANAVGSIVGLIALWLLLDGVLIQGFFTVANNSFSVRDLDTDPGAAAPASTLRSGSPASLVPWDTLGRQGRNFVASGPSVTDLNAYNGGGAVEPIRVYVGMRSADTLDERADLLLQELIRTRAFDRDALVVATTTGTGWLDPYAFDTLEYLYNGNVATAGLQYSFLPSWISLLADQEAVKDTSIQQFRAIHAYWSQLPEDDRPDLFLFGLSLGSFGVEQVLTSPNIINEPINGALMAGPTFLNPMHTQVTAQREPGSTPEFPLVDNGRTVRFTGNSNNLGHGGEVWGPSRLVYLQHGSDPITFLSTDLAWNKPDWLMEGQRSSDVSPRMQWYPLVTMVQVAIDMAGAAGVPEGFGHLYTVSSYADAWAGLAGTDTWSGGTWTAADSAALQEHIAATAPRD